MGMLKEFNEFAIKGNAVDMAVGIVIGAAFGKIVSSLVNDVIMPPIGLLMGKMKFSTLAIHLNEETAINYGVFINNVIDFVIVAFAIFLVIKQINRLKNAATAGSERQRTVRDVSPPFPRWQPVAPIARPSWRHRARSGKADRRGRLARPTGTK